MKIFKRQVDNRDHSGFIVVHVDKDEDMYHLYNIFNKKYCITASTIRNVVEKI